MEKRAFARLSDTLNIEFVPATKNNNGKYLFDKVTITYEGRPEIKGESIRESKILISDTTSLRIPIIKVPLNQFLRNQIFYGMSVTIDINGVEMKQSGVSKPVTVSDDDLHQKFTCTR